MISVYIFHNELFVGLGLILVVLVLWSGFRYSIKRKSRVEINVELTTTPLAIKRPPQVKSEHTVAAATFLPQEIEEEVTDVNLMLEEAELYANLGRPASAVKILQTIIQRNPSTASAWSLLLSSYSSLGKAAEFEDTAREFLKYHKESPLWSGIQAIGRTLDQNNPLYIDNNSGISASTSFPNANSRRPIGDILIGMGVLTEESLQRWLDIFNPTKHGRFGGYLLSCKVITLAQLDQALLRQQGLMPNAL